MSKFARAILALGAMCLLQPSLAAYGCTVKSGFRP